MSGELAAAALCAVGAERVVSQELRRMGLRTTDSGFGRVRFAADTAGLYRALMGLRAADRVLLEAGRFRAADFDALFEGARSVPWEDLIPRGMGLAVTKARARCSRLRAETRVQAVVHKAAAARLCGKFGVNRLPDADGASRAELRVHLDKDEASLLLDISGEPLFKRGYRSGSGGAAPLRETTAAAIILLAGWRRKFPLRDPFCGAGTIVTEAALFAWDAAPGLCRKFALENLVISDKAVERQVRGELLSRVDFSRRTRIHGSDSDSRAVSLAKANLARARGLLEKAAQACGADSAGSAGDGGALPDFAALDMKDAAPEAGEEAGFLITNPPYGRRLGDPAASEAVYAEMGGLARRFAGWKLALITDHPGFESFFARKATACREITNGAINAYFYQYDRL
ncbi:MAG: RNA methyltransferase [Treponematales bacterium]